MDHVVALFTLDLAQVNQPTSNNTAGQGSQILHPTNQFCGLTTHSTTQTWSRVELICKIKEFHCHLEILSIIYQFQSRTKMLVCVVGSCPPSNNFLGVKLLHWAHSLLTKLFCPFLIYHITFFECALPRGQTHYVSKYTQSLKVGKRCQFSFQHHID